MRLRPEPAPSDAGGVLDDPEVDEPHVLDDRDGDGHDGDGDGEALDERDDDLEDDGAGAERPPRARWDPRRAYDRLADAISDEPALGVVLGAIALWCLVFGFLVVLRQHRFRTVDFDLGIHDQSIWLLAHFRDFCTVRGLPVFGHHATFGYVLLVPFAWLHGGPDVWNVLQVVAIASGALPLYLLARHRLGRPWLAAALGLAWLLQPPLQWFAWETFHPEVMAIPFLIWAYWCAERRHHWGYAVCLLLAVVWKEDVALFVAVLGLVFVLRRRPKLGLCTAAFGAAWFIVFGMWMVPHLAGGGTVYAGLYGNLGRTPSEIARTALLHPDLVVERLADNDAPAYGRDIAAPFAFTPLAAPEVLAAGVPQALVNLLSTANFTWDLIYHYQALPMAAMGIGMVEGVARIRRWRPRLTTFAVGATVAGALAGSCAWGISPISRDYHVGYWPLSARTEQSALDAAVARVGPADGVAADYNFVPHLTHRDIIYTFPNPWQNKNFGVSALSSGDPAQVRWLVVDTSHFQPSDLELFDQIVDSGEFTVRQDSAIPGIDPFGHPARLVVAERVKPPTNPDGPPPTGATTATTQP